MERGIIFHREKQERRARAWHTSTSRTVPYFSNRDRMSSGVEFQGTFCASNLVRENSSAPIFGPSLSEGTLATVSSWEAETNWKIDLLVLLALMEMEGWWVREVERERWMSPWIEWDGFCGHERDARKIGWCCLERMKEEDEEQGRRSRAMAGVHCTLLTLF